MQRRAHDGDTLVYSSDPGAKPSDAPAAKRVVAAQSVRIWLEKKGRNGTPVSIIRGLAVDPHRLAALASNLKRACGTGGSAKDGEIIIQGDHRGRLVALLAADGISAKLAGG
jgi:translation initiation factor 1